MGYTHYYYVPKQFNQELFAKVVTDFKKILPEIEKINPVSVKDYYSEDETQKLIHIVNYDGKANTKPEITNDVIAFNGLGENSHESFVLDRITKTELTSLNGTKFDKQQDEESGKYFNFTKTARKPYDLAVCAVLIIAKQHLNDHIVIHSDGVINDEWVYPKNFVQKHLGYGKDFVLDGDNEN